MSDLTQEQFEQLPEFLKNDYVQDGEVYRHGGVKKLKESLNQLDNKYKETSSKLTEYESKQQQQQAEAERKALEKLKAEGKVDEILADAERKHGETLKQYQERIDKMRDTARAGRRDEIASDLSSRASDRGRAAFKRLVSSLIDYDPETGTEIYFNEDGSASSAKTRAEFYRDVIEKSDTFEPLLKGEVTTTGAGNVNGNTRGSASATTMRREQFQQLDSHSQMKFVKDGGTLI